MNQLSSNRVAIEYCSRLRVRAPGGWGRPGLHWASRHSSSFATFWAMYTECVHIRRRGSIVALACDLKEGECTTSKLEIGFLGGRRIEFGHFLPPPCEIMTGQEKNVILGFFGDTGKNMFRP